jgi:hypothetical protein
MLQGNAVKFVFITAEVRSVGHRRTHSLGEGGDDDAFLY